MLYVSDKKIWVYISCSLQSGRQVEPQRHRLLQDRTTEHTGPRAWQAENKQLYYLWFLFLVSNRLRIRHLMNVREKMTQGREINIKYFWYSLRNVTTNPGNE